MSTTWNVSNGRSIQAAINREKMTLVELPSKSGRRLKFTPRIEQIRTWSSAGRPGRSPRSSTSRSGRSRSPVPASASASAGRGRPTSWRRPPSAPGRRPASPSMDDQTDGVGLTPDPINGSRSETSFRLVIRHGGREKVVDLPFPPDAAARLILEAAFGGRSVGILVADLIGGVRCRSPTSNWSSWSSVPSKFADAKSCWQAIGRSPSSPTISKPLATTCQG